MLSGGEWEEPKALLISGPSKTADIEQTLAYGVHGPKRLVVVIPDARTARPGSFRYFTDPTVNPAMKRSRKML